MTHSLHIDSITRQEVNGTLVNGSGAWPFTVFRTPLGPRTRIDASMAMHRASITRAAAPLMNGQIR